jgi:hypothetical protein
VWQDGFEGVSVQRDGQSNPLTIAWGDNAGDELPIIYASSATVRFFQETEGEFSDLFDSNKFKNRVYIYKNGSLFWQGYIDGNTWEEDRAGNGIDVPVQFTATDMLAGLKDVNYADVITTTKPLSLYTIIRQILNYAGWSDAFINYYINWESFGGDKWLETYLKPTVFIEKNCYEVIENLLWGCRLFQRDGDFYIIAYSGLLNDNIIVNVNMDYTDDFHNTDFRAGDFRSRIPGTDTQYRYIALENYWFENKMSIEMLPGIKKVIVNENRILVENNLINGNFEDGTTGWNANAVSGGISRVYQLSGDDIRYFACLNDNYEGSFLVASGKYMSQQIPNYFAANYLRIQFEYGIISSDESDRSPLHCQILINNGTTTHYLKYQVAGATNNELRLEWTEDETLLQLGARLMDGVISYELLEAGLNNADLGTNLKKFDLVTNQIPSGGGTVEIRLFVPSRNPIAPPYIHADGAIYSNVNISTTLVDGQKFQNKDVITITNDLSYPTVIEVDMLLCSDLGFLDNFKKIFTNILESSSGTYSFGWRLEGGTTFKANEHRARVINAIANRTRRNYQATVADVRLSMRIILIDNEAPVLEAPIRLLENGVNYHDRMNTIEGQFVEIINQK